MGAVAIDWRLHTRRRLGRTLLLIVVFLAGQSTYAIHTHHDETTGGEERCVLSALPHT